MREFLMVTPSSYGGRSLVTRVSFSPSQDGLTHINAYSKSSTELGRYLSNFARTQIMLPNHGTFQSIEGYWYWLGCTHPSKDRLRHLWGFEAKKVGRELGTTDWPGAQVEDFQDHIKAAIRVKLKQNRLGLEMLVASNLPIVHYYWYGEPPKVTVPDQGKWIWEYYAHLRTITQQHRSK